MTHIEGQDQHYWQNRFVSGGWANAGGNYQSVLFMQTILGVLFNSPLRQDFAGYASVDLSVPKHVGVTPCTIYDYGCAEGDGTAVLQAAFPMATVRGADWSADAVIHAMKRWPTLKFTHGDITNPIDYCDLIFTSHTIEHLTDPAACISRLLDFCTYLVVGVPPIREDENGGHTGAIPLEKWVSKTNPVFHESVNTVRWGGGSPIIEGTTVLVYQGRHAVATRRAA